MSEMSLLAKALPIPAASCRTPESLGLVMSENTLPSNDATEMSSGTERPKERMAFKPPVAEKSSGYKMAVGLSSGTSLRVNRYDKSGSE